MMPTELTVSLGTGEITPSEWRSHTSRSDLPNADEFDVDIDGECLLECLALFPACFIVLAIHPVRERDLLIITSR